MATCTHSFNHSFSHTICCLRCRSVSEMLRKKNLSGNRITCIFNDGMPMILEPDLPKTILFIIYRKMNFGMYNLQQTLRQMKTYRSLRERLGSCRRPTV